MTLFHFSSSLSSKELKNSISSSAIWLSPILLILFSLKPPLIRLLLHHSNEMTLTKVTCNLHITKSRGSTLGPPSLFRSAATDKIFGHSILFHTFSSHGFQDTTLAVFLPPWLFLQSVFPDLLSVTEYSQVSSYSSILTHIHVTCSDLMYSPL